MFKKYQQVGKPLGRSEMQSIKGGAAMSARMKYNCLVQDVPGWWVLCSNVDPTSNGCAYYCELIGVCSAGANECV